MTKKPSYEELEQKLKALEKETSAYKEMLRKSQEQYYSFIEYSTLPLLIYNEEKIVYLNLEAIKMFGGIYKEDFVGKSIWDFLHSDFTFTVSENINDLQEKTKSVIKSHKEKIIRLDGKIIDVGVTAGTINWQGQSMFQVVFCDITENKKTEVNIKQSWELYRSLFENTGTATVILEDDMTISMVNTKFERMSGCSRFEIVGRMKWTEFTAEEDKKRISFYHSQRRNNNPQIPGKYEYRFVDRQGNIKEVWVKVGMIPNTKKSVASVTDITCFKGVQRKIQNAKKEWERTFDSIDEVIAILDTQMRVVRVNRAVIRLLNIPFKKIIGKHCYELFNGSSQPCSDCLQINSDQNKLFSSMEVSFSFLNKTFQRSISPILDDSQELLGFVCFAKDITDEKKLRDQIRQSQKMEAIGTLAGGIAHDFNNILMAIMGYSELSMYQVPDDSQLLSNLNEIRTAGTRAKELVQQILTFSRHKEHEPSPVQVHIIVKEALRLMRSTLPATIEICKNISISKPVMADQGRIHQMLINLFTNAYHAMDDQGGVLNVGLCEVNLDADAIDLYPELEDTGQYLKLTVSDSGRGISPEVMERIFDPYYTTKEKGKGTGFGLAIVYGIVKRYNGAIRVDSTPGKGSTFRVYLPVVESVCDIKKSAVDLIPRGNESILFVDDEKAISQMGKLMLERLGYQVTAQTSGKEALEVFHIRPAAFDLVITDMNMPHMTGIELIKELKRIKPDIPVILCTGFIDDLNKRQAKAKGCSAIIMKPFTHRKIANTIRMVLDA